MPAVQQTVAILGTGIMGTAMARRIIEAGHRTRVWNRTQTALEPLVQLGAEGALSPQEAVEGADVVVTMLADGPATIEVMLGAGGGLEGCAAGCTWLQMGTVGIDAIEQLAAAALAAGVTFVDAPVLGTRAPAEAGELVVLAAGPEGAQERAAVVLDAVADRVLWMEGPAGHGTRLKLAVNTWVLGLVSLLAETLAVARGLGVDPGLFFETIRGSALDVAYAHLKGQAMLEQRFPTSFPLRLAEKDVRLILEAGRAAGLELPLCEAVQTLLHRALAMGHGDDDFAAVSRALEPS